MSSSSANWRFTVASLDSEPDATPSSRPSTSTPPTDTSPPSTWGRLRGLGGRITRSRADLRAIVRAEVAAAAAPAPASPVSSHYSSPSIDFTADPFAAALGPNPYENTYGFSYSCDPRLSPPQPPTPTRATFPQQPAPRGHSRSASKSSTMSSSSNASSISNSSRVSQVAALGFKRSEASWALRHPRTNGDVRAAAELLAHIAHLGTSFEDGARRRCRLCREEEEEDIERARDAFLRTR
ncbi:uncharacterized protein LOC62_07G009718 [Vanrija pseudolonga]|uniref:UBA domain-containing protein n=1 Tax=Vanrija pseudolonga TaxID=143232 RepID=A0AAF1BUL3_9TREE|nr:hypothetical protein LOC62_07G009718 [Vanrija pseudolonga]